MKLVAVAKEVVYVLLAGVSLVLLTQVQSAQQVALNVAILAMVALHYIVIAVRSRRGRVS